jgi:hypothetical protein
MREMLEAEEREKEAEEKARVKKQRDNQKKKEKKKKSNDQGRNGHIQKVINVDDADDDAEGPAANGSQGVVHAMPGDSEGLSGTSRATKKALGEPIVAPAPGLSSAGIGRGPAKPKPGSKESPAGFKEVWPFLLTVAMETLLHSVPKSIVRSSGWVLLYMDSPAVPLSCCMCESTVVTQPDCNPFG